MKYGPNEWMNWLIGYSVAWTPEACLPNVHKVHSETPPLQWGHTQNTSDWSPREVGLEEVHCIVFYFDLIYSFLLAICNCLLSVTGLPEPVVGDALLQTVGGWGTGDDSASALPGKWEGGKVQYVTAEYCWDNCGGLWAEKLTQQL